MSDKTAVNTTEAKDWWEYYPHGTVITERLYYFQLIKENEDDEDLMGDYYGRNY